MSQQFLKHTQSYGRGNVTVYRPMEACAYAAIYHFVSEPEPLPEVKEGETPELPKPIESIVFEYLTQRTVTQRQALKAFRKHRVHPSDVIVHADGSQVVKNPKDVFLIEELVTVPETMSPAIENPAEVAAIKNWLDENLATIVTK